MQTWVLIAFSGGLFSNLAHFVTRKALKDEDSTAFSWWFELMRVIAFGILALFNFKLEGGLINLFWLLTIGFLEVFTIYFYTKMHSFTELSISSILIRLRLIWIPLVAWLIIGEKLARFEYLGIGLVFWGLITVALPKKTKTNKGVVYGLIFSILGATISVLMKITAQIASTPVVLLFLSWPTVLVFPVLMKNAKQRLADSFKYKIRENVLFLVFNIVSMYLLVEALRLGPASKVLGVYQSMMIIGVLMGIVLLKERENMGKKIIGALLTMGGILLLV